MKRGNAKNTNGITLIALIITIIIMLILAGVVISLTLGENGLFSTAKYAVTKNSEASAKEKLEILLLNMQAEKETNNKYNNEYLTSKIEEQDMTIIDEDIVLVNGWMFRINRNVPEISESLGTYKTDDGITNLDLNNEEIIMGVTKQENIDIENPITQIKVTTGGIEKGQYKWNIKDKNIATIDSDGNITPIGSGKTQIECKSIDGKKVYATCKLTVEEREYLYYYGTSIVEFDEPLCGMQCTLTGSPYFMNEYIYSKASNKNYPDSHEQINYLTKNKIDFSKYKGIVIKKKVEISGVDSGSYLRPVQSKTCSDWGSIPNDLNGNEYDGWKPTIIRENQEEYYDVSNYNNQAYLDTVITVGKYESGVVSTADIYIYEIFLVK